MHGQMISAERQRAVARPGQPVAPGLPATVPPALQWATLLPADLHRRVAALAAVWRSFAARLPAPRIDLRDAVIASLAVHVVLLGGLWLRATLLTAGSPPPPALASLEWVQQTSPVVGAGAPPAPTDQPATQQSGNPLTELAVPLPPAVPMPLPGLRLAVPMPPAARPTAAQLQAERSASTQPTDAHDAESGSALAIGLTPASLDATRHNLPPHYPEEARRLGQRGSVDLLIHVAPDGSVTGVDVQQGSGTRMLDQAAREAALHWHFRPGKRDGQTVASDFPINVTFDFNDRRQP
jgi:protein TonB